MSELKMWIVVNIGCIECGVTSAIVGMFDCKDTAEKIAEFCREAYAWRESGQNEFIVFEIPKLNVINPEYKLII